MPRGEPGKMGILGIDGTIIHSLCRIKYCRTSNRRCPGLPEVGWYTYTTSQGVGVVSRLVPSCWEANTPSFEGNSLDHGQQLTIRLYSSYLPPEKRFQSCRYQVVSLPGNDLQIHGQYVDFWPFHREESLLVAALFLNMQCIMQAI